MVPIKFFPSAVFYDSAVCKQTSYSNFPTGLKKNSLDPDPYLDLRQDLDPYQTKIRPDRKCSFSDPVFIYRDPDPAQNLKTDPVPDSAFFFILPEILNIFLLQMLYCQKHYGLVYCKRE